MSVANPTPVLVVGAGIMGSGIAQVAAQAGHPVWLHDARTGAAREACRRLADSLQGLVERGRMNTDTAAGIVERIRPIDDLADARQAEWVIEAIVEDLDVKRELLLTLESLVAPHCVLATNTSSISVTALARGLRHPQRVVGMHFFNPVPVMKLVEVVSGLHTDPAVAEQVAWLAQRWGKTAVHARSTPGFIVNRIARPFYAEALALLHERAATPATLDACLRAAGFRMGPCELMDLIGHDTNFAVTESVFRANFGDRRYGPSLVQRELVDAGWLGRKSGRGFYPYRDGVAVREPLAPEASDEAPLPPTPVVVHGHTSWCEDWARRLAAAGHPVSRKPHSDWAGLDIGGAQLRLTDGRTAGELAALGPQPAVAVFDLPLQAADATLAHAVAAAAPASWHRDAPRWLKAAGVQPVSIADTPGLIVARTVAMLINEAADAVQQGVCTADGADQAMKLGVNYPAGPFEWLAQWGAAPVVGLIEQLDRACRGERYRVSPWLRQRVWAAANPSPTPRGSVAPEH